MDTIRDFVSFEAASLPEIIRKMNEAAVQNYVPTGMVNHFIDPVRNRVVFYVVMMRYFDDLAPDIAL